MLNLKLFCDLFKVTGFDIFRFAFFDLYHEIFIRKNVYSAVHGIIFIFGNSYPFGFMPAMNEYFIHIHR